MRRALLRVRPHFMLSPVVVGARGMHAKCGQLNASTIRPKTIPQPFEFNPAARPVSGGSLLMRVELRPLPWRGRRRHPVPSLRLRPLVCEFDPPLASNGSVRARDRTRAVRSAHVDFSEPPVQLVGIAGAAAPLGSHRRSRRPGGAMWPIAIAAHCASAARSVNSRLS